MLSISLWIAAINNINPEVFTFDNEMAFKPTQVIYLEQTNGFSNNIKTYEVIKHISLDHNGV
jgi:hypothetical protein